MFLYPHPEIKSVTKNIKNVLLKINIIIWFIDFCLYSAQLYQVSKEWTTGRIVDTLPLTENCAFFALKGAKLGGV
jgi:hypothetical protein